MKYHNFELDSVTSSNFALHQENDRMKKALSVMKERQAVLVKVIDHLKASLERHAEAADSVCPVMAVAIYDDLDDVFNMACSMLDRVNQAKDT